MNQSNIRPDGVGGVDSADKLLTRKEAAKRLNLQPHTLAVWTSTGRHGLRIVKIGRSVRYRSQDIETLIEANMIG